MSPRIATLLAVATVIAVPTVASAAPRSAASAAATCTAGSTVVSGTGLPTDQIINFMVTDGSGTSGWVLGFSGDGTWQVTVPAPSGATTYEFVSRTSGKDGSRYTVFARC